MRRVVLAIGLAAVVPTAAAQSGTGNSLVAQCHSAVDAANGRPAIDPTGAMYCFGILGGIFNTMVLWAPLNGRKFCAPQSAVTNGQLARIAVKYMEDHPKELGGADALLASMALFDAFACPADTKP